MKVLGFNIKEVVAIAGTRHGRKDLIAAIKNADSSLI
jgi:hypothetical protein